MQNAQYFQHLPIIENCIVALAECCKAVIRHLQSVPKKKSSIHKLK